MSPLRTIFTLTALAALQITLVGCESTTTTTPAPATSNYHPTATAAALAFDPPMTQNQPLPDLSRDGRATSAFVGYEQSVTSVSSTYQRDEIRGFNGNFDRQAYTGKTSVTTR